MRIFGRYEDKCNAIKAKIHQELFEHPKHTWDWSETLTDYKQGRLQALESAWEITNDIRVERDFKVPFKSVDSIRKRVYALCLDTMTLNGTSQYKKGFNEALAAI